MKPVRYFARWLIPALVLCFPGSSVAVPEHIEMAITVDDLPSPGALPSGTTRADVARSMIHTLQAAGVPRVYGFMNARRLADDPETADVLKLWVQAGFPLGNHTYAHMDLNKSDAAAFQKDIAANEPSLELFMGSRDWHWFRYPFLHEGDTLEKRRSVRTYLHEHGYKVAQVTLDFQDYAWSDPYARCVAIGDTNAIAWLKASYLGTAAEYVSLGQKLAYMLYGRDIKHVLLLHMGAFDSVMLSAFLDQLARQGAQFVSLEVAEEDPAFQRDSDGPLVHGGTMLDRLIQEHHMPYPPHTEKPLEKLNSICR